MEQSYQLADFLDDMDIEFEVFPDDSEGVFVEFKYLDSFYEVEFSKSGEVTVNGEKTTYKEFISNTF